MKNSSFIVMLMACTLFCVQPSKAQKITENAVAGSFPLFANGKAATLVYDTADAAVVGIAAKAFGEDVRLISGITPGIVHKVQAGVIPVIIGTLGQSGLIDMLAKRGAIPVAAVKGKWETFCLTVVKKPFADVDMALVIFGSDPRGTAYGVFELSRKAGVSPWVWWADVKPRQRSALYVSTGAHVTGPPSVQYRGIFINDEDWGLQPWAARHMDTDIKDIGPNTYQKVFELMLRLKANYLWPAMHPCTKAFWYYPGNPEMAGKYRIVLGGSHCEPLLRNNVFEWDHNFEHEYGQQPGKWQYDINQEQIDRYWRDRVAASKNNDAVYTVGMRGIHDGGMPGPASPEKKKALLETVIANQREILSKGLDKTAADIPQIFCPYKEVLELYKLGMKLPEDITLAWADDNYGYIRQLSDPEEQKRSGGSGVYYHLSYWGAPEDYLWLSTISPTLISYELTKAYQLQARKLWVFNVGDIKPAEAELQFAMDLAWDVEAWRPEKAQLYMEQWAAATFGEEYGKQIGRIKKEYYRLAATGKPEHLNRITFTNAEAAQRLADYQQLVKATRQTGQVIPQYLQDAYFELVAYPVEAACNMNEKILYARQSLALAAAGNPRALTIADSAKAAFANIEKLTVQYNKMIAGGKWDGIMDWHPRKRPVFQMPETATPEMLRDSVHISAGDTLTAPVVIPAADYISKHDKEAPLRVIEGLGPGKAGLAQWPMQLTSYSDTEAAPYVDYKAPVHTGENKITVKCLSDFPLYTGMKLRYAIAVNGQAPVIKNIASLAETKSWASNILKGYAAGETTFNSDKEGMVSIRIYLLDPGVVINSIELN